MVTKKYVDDQMVPGSPGQRMTWILDELATRFPDAYQPFSSQAPEVRFMEAIDKLLAVQRALKPVGPSMVAEVLKKCYEADRYHPSRDADSVFKAVVSEIGEVAVEISIENGSSYKAPGPDGIIGECIDAIAALIDLIYRVNPNITEDEMADIARTKCVKWIDKLIEHYGNDVHP